MVSEIDEDAEPFSDSYGRVTFFGMRLGEHMLPVYQPGTIMFDSGVKDGDVAVHHGGSQQNGPVLGNGCAIFLAKFLAKLCLTYNETCQQKGIDHNVGMDKACYRKALEKTLKKAALEDLNEHGRLLALKDHLLSLVDRSQRVSITTLGLFQLKDYCAIDPGLARQLSADSSTYEEISAELETLEISARDAAKAVNTRFDNMTFPEAKAYSAGYKDVKAALPIINAAIQSKDGLVSEEEKPGFRQFMKHYLTAENLEIAAAESKPRKPAHILINQDKYFQDARP